MDNATQPIARRTEEAIRLLKADWEADPCWDIEETEGFEAHREELTEYREQYAAACEQRFTEEMTRLAKRENITVLEARHLHSAEAGRERACDEACRMLRHLFKNAGLAYEDIDADILGFVEPVLRAAECDGTINQIRANAKPLRLNEP